MGVTVNQTSTCIQASLCVDHKAGAALSGGVPDGATACHAGTKAECETWMNGTGHWFITHPLRALQSHNTQPVPVTHARLQGRSIACISARVTRPCVPSARLPISSIKPHDEYASTAR